MKKFNPCRGSFGFIFSTLLSAYIVATLTLIFLGPNRNAQEDFANRQNPFAILLVLGLFLGVSWYIGTKVYDSYLGPKLRQLGWNESSYLNSLGIIILTILAFEVLTFVSSYLILALILISKIFGL